MRSLRRSFFGASRPAVWLLFLGTFACLFFGIHASLLISLAHAQPKAKTPASVEASREIETVIAKGNGTLQGNQAPFDAQTYRIHPIDTRQFINGGTLIIDITVGSGESRASFGLLAEGTPPEKIARWDSALYATGDWPPGSKSQIIYRFSRGQVFHFVAGGNWFSPRSATNIYTFVARVKAQQVARPELRFVRQTGAAFGEIKQLNYGGPFYIEAEFASVPQDPPERNVKLEWGEGQAREVKVYKQKEKDGRLFRSKVLMLEGPIPSRTRTDCPR